MAMAALALSACNGDARSADMVSPGSGGMLATSSGGASGSSGSAPTAPPPPGGSGGSAAPASTGVSTVVGAGGASDRPGGTGGVGTPDGGDAGPARYPDLTAEAIGELVKVSSGYTLAETPLWDPCGHQLFFADVMGGGGIGVIHALAADGTVSVFMSGTGNAAGLAFDVDGSLILAQMGGKPGHIARRDLSGVVHVLDQSGVTLHTPDDVVVRSDGTIYFSDGDYCPVGTKTGYNAKLPVYLIRPGSPDLVNGGTVSGPNGLEFSPDEQTLYVNGYGEGAIWPFHVSSDGSLTKPDKALVTGLTNPDGLCLDAAGNLYVAVNKGLDVLRPDGTKVKHLSIDTTVSSCSNTSGATNCAFGGEDGKTLYVTNWTTLFAIQSMPIPGLDWTVNRKRLKCP